MGAAPRAARGVPLVARVEARVEPVGAPLPDVAGAAPQAVAVGLEAAHRRGAEVPVGQRVAGGERALPDVHAVVAGGLELVAPGVDRPLQPAAGGVLPL